MIYGKKCFFHEKHKFVCQKHVLFVKCVQQIRSVQNAVFLDFLPPRVPIVKKMKIYIEMEYTDHVVWNDGFNTENFSSRNSQIS